MEEFWKLNPQSVCGEFFSNQVFGFFGRFRQFSSQLRDQVSIIQLLVINENQTLDFFFSFHSSSSASSSWAHISSGPFAPFGSPIQIIIHQLVPVIWIEANHRLLFDIQSNDSYLQLSSTSPTLRRPMSRLISDLSSGLFRAHFDSIFSFEVNFQFWIFS